MKKILRYEFKVVENSTRKIFTIKSHRPLSDFWKYTFTTYLSNWDIYDIYEAPKGKCPMCKNENMTVDYPALPCGHKGICLHCMRIRLRKGLVCKTCREPIHNFIRATLEN